MSKFEKNKLCAFVTDRIPDILEGTVNVPDIICETGATKAPAINPAISKMAAGNVQKQHLPYEKCNKIVSCRYKI